MAKQYINVDVKIKHGFNLHPDDFSLEVVATMHFATAENLCPQSLTYRE